MRVRSSKAARRPPPHPPFRVFRQDIWQNTLIKRSARPLNSSIANGVNDRKRYGAVSAGPALKKHIREKDKAFLRPKCNLRQSLALSPSNRYGLTIVRFFPLRTGCKIRPSSKYARSLPPAARFRQTEWRSPRRADTLFFPLRSPRISLPQQSHVKANGNNAFSMDMPSAISGYVLTP